MNHRESFFTRRRLRAFALVLGLHGAGCDRDRATAIGAALGATSEAAGLVDRESPPPEAVDVLCDAAAGSTCDRSGFAAVVESAATFANARPGSVLRFWLVGRTAADTSEVGSIAVPLRAERSRRHERAEERRFVESVRAAICPPTRPRLEGLRSEQAPLAESLAKVALTRSPSLPRRVLFLTSGRESSDLGHFACRPLPTLAQWRAILDRRHVLAPGSLAGARVHYALMTGGPASHRDCPPMTVARELHVRELWRTALTHAGAREVTFDTGLPDLAALAAEGMNTAGRGR